MIIKTISALSMYIIPFLVILLSGTSNLLLLFSLWMIMGLGMSFIGTSVMHDALHGSYSNKKMTNRILGFSAMILGAESAIWKIQHNVLHHTYTNIEHADEDIEPRYVLRFSPNQPKRWFHRYQHLYAVLFYSLSTLIWVTYKDFNKLVNYRKENHVKTKKEFNKLLSGIIIKKILYFSIFLGLPIFILPFSPGLVLLMFISMHLVSGLTLSLIFQPAHVVPTSSFTETKNPKIDINWSIHQLMTTSNFAMNNRLLSWFIGGLNFQIEHHLFPNICHIHYRHLSKIILKTTQEFNLPYYSQKSFRSALFVHFSMLKDLGKYQKLTIENSYQK